MGYAAAKKAGVYGTGVVEVSIMLIEAILKQGWSTGLKSLHCVEGIPADAQLTTVTIVHPGAVRIYFRSQDLATQRQPHAIVARYKSGDPQTIEAAQRLVQYENFRDAIRPKRKRGRIATRLRIGAAVDARIDGLIEAWDAAIHAIMEAHPGAHDLAKAIREAAAAKTEEQSA